MLLNEVLSLNAQESVFVQAVKPILPVLNEVLSLNAQESEDWAAVSASASPQ